MPHVDHMHRALVNRENHPVAPVSPAGDQWAQLILEHPILPRPRAPFRETRQRINLGLDRVEPTLGRLGCLRYIGVTTEALQRALDAQWPAGADDHCWSREAVVTSLRTARVPFQVAPCAADPGGS